MRPKTKPMPAAIQITGMAPSITAPSTGTTGNSKAPASRATLRMPQSTNVPIIAEFTDLGDYPEYQEVLPIARVVIDDYLKGTFDKVFLVYPYFVNTMTQQPEARQLLPIEPPEEAATHGVDYLYEPNRETVLAEILPRYVEVQIYEAVLEGIASEQSARMVAMRSATDAANDMIQELTLTFAPKVLAILAAIWLLGDFMAGALTEFLRDPLMTAMLGI